MKNIIKGYATSIGVGVLLSITFLAAWITHIAFCFNHDKWGFLIAGALFFPVAIVHGIGIWFGFWA